jgi:drug/metabolite transporter (DMT)-like permease
MLVTSSYDTLQLTTPQRIVAGVPNPIIGPRGVRKLLVIRGVTGCVNLHTLPSFLVIISSSRFFGLCGLYLSLQYLSVADATVLTFLTPLSTAVAGCLLLKEGYSVTQAVAGGESHVLTSLV